MDSHDVPKGLGAAATVAAGGVPAAEAADEKKAAIDEKNPSRAPPGTAISLPPAYLPTPSVKHRNNYFPQREELGKDEMWITLMGSQPFPPHLDEAGTCIMVELDNGKRLFFDPTPVPEINDIFSIHLHVDHDADLPSLWAFAPFVARFKPLRVINLSDRKPELGTKAMCEHLKKRGPSTCRPSAAAARSRRASRSKSPSSTSTKTPRSAPTRTA